MDDIPNLSDDEILKLFDTSYFLETSQNFIRCNKKDSRTVELISKKDMEDLQKRYLRILKKE